MTHQLDNPAVKSRTGWKKILARLVRPFQTAWPDQGRFIVQSPVIAELLASACVAGCRPRHVLNAGAGEGLYSRRLLGLPGVEHLTEFDISYDKLFRKPTDARQRLIYGSLTEIPVEDGWADLILCSEVLEHVADDRRALAELARVVAPGGWVLLTVPTPPAPYDPAHVREGYLPGELKDLAAEVGLTVVETRFCMFAAFKFLLRWWRMTHWIPKGILPFWAHLDRIFPQGTPTDLLLLCHRQS